jgi:hypothetical protein
MSSTVKRSSRTTLRNLISGGGRKGKDKGADVVSLSDAVDEDPLPKSSSNGGGDRAKQQQPTTRESQQQKTSSSEGGPTASAPATKKSSRSSSVTNAKEERATRSSNTAEPNGPESTTTSTRGRSAGGSGGGNVLQRLRERSRSRSRTRKESGSDTPTATKELLVAVTSCRSDGYYSQKAPGSISKLPRKAPTNLKLFHELAVGVKDAYAAVGATPRNPEQNSEPNSSASSREARLILWDFIGNLDFVRYCVSGVGQRLSDF